MPVYVYSCQACGASTEVFQRSMSSALEASCERCGSGQVRRAVTQFAVPKSEMDRLQALDPRYHKKVDDAIARTPEADPMRHLQRMTPFSQAADAGDPIKF